MKILTKEEVIEAGGFSHLRFHNTHSELLDAIKQSEPLGGVLIEGTEWGYIQPPTAKLFNSYFEKIGSPVRIKIKTISHGKQFCFTRIK